MSPLFKGENGYQQNLLEDLKTGVKLQKRKYGSATLFISPSWLEWLETTKQTLLKNILKYSEFNISI